MQCHDVLCCKALRQSVGCCRLGSVEYAESSLQVSGVQQRQAYQWGGPASAACCCCCAGACGAYGHKRGAQQTHREHTGMWAGKRASTGNGSRYLQVPVSWRKGFSHKAYVKLAALGCFGFFRLAQVSTRMLCVLGTYRCRCRCRCRVLHLEVDDVSLPQASYTAALTCETG